MKALVKTAKSEWEGTAYAAIRGDLGEIARAGIGQPASGFRDSYILLRNETTGKECGAIVKVLSAGPDAVVEVDPLLLSDLSSETGSCVELLPLPAVSAKQVRVAVSKGESNAQEVRNCAKTYLARHPLAVGQKKMAYLLIGDKISIEVLDVSPSPHAVFSNTTELTIDASRTASSAIRFDDVRGLEHEKKKIKERILLPLLHPEFFSGQGIRLPRGILFYGPPGCGKTMLARALSNEVSPSAREPLELGPDVFSAMPGESSKAVKEVFQKAHDAAPAVIVIDEIDSVGASRTSLGGDPRREVVTELLRQMDGLRSLSNVVVVATTNLPDVLDAALRRPGRFDYEIEIPVPDKRGRQDVLRKLTERMRLADDVRLDEVARRTHGFVGADLVLLCREAAFEALSRVGALGALDSGQSSPQGAERIVHADFDNALRNVKPSALREFRVEVPSALGWSDVGGLATIKDTVIQEIVRVLKAPEDFEKVGIKPVRGILFYGPPGTGKTLLARVIANEAEANFISIKGPEVNSMWHGESEKRIRAIFAKARESSPCIIFFDEMDSIAAVRGKTVSDVADKVVNQLLTEMDGFETGKHVCVIGATNRAELIDEALKRPGRFDYQILVPLPDVAGIEQIYRIHLKNKPLASEVSVNRLAVESEGFSGSQIAEVCRRAAMMAFREAGYVVDKTKVEMRHLLPAIALVKKTAAEVEPRPQIGF